MDTSDNSRERLFITTGGRLDRGEDMIKKEMIAMLLAGGQGSRLGVLTSKVGGGALPRGRGGAGGEPGPGAPEL